MSKADRWWFIVLITAAAGSFILGFSLETYQVPKQVGDAILFGWFLTLFMWVLLEPLFRFEDQFAWVFWTVTVGSFTFVGFIGLMEYGHSIAHEVLPKLY